MPFNINTYKARGPELGIARPALFDVTLTPPQGLTNIGDKFSFLCRASSLPASTLGLLESFYFGRSIKLSGDRTFGDWQCVITNDEDFLIRNMLEEWSNKINTHISNRLDPAYSSISSRNNNKSYKATATVNQYGKSGPGDASGIIKAYQFEGIFPLEISPIELDHEAANQGETFAVTFAVDYWIPITKNSDGGAVTNPDSFGILQPDT